jgi:AhpD family alkylhydroperoxidase
MKARLTNPTAINQEAIQALWALSGAIEKSGLSRKLIGLVEMRASQINGCGVCLDMHAREMKMAGEMDERLHAIAGWHDAPYFTDAERAALALTEAVTRLSDRSNAVPDEVWNEAARHFNEKELGNLVLSIGLINLWNRLNVSTRQVAGEWIKSPQGQAWLASRSKAAA